MSGKMSTIFKLHEFLNNIYSLNFSAPGAAMDKSATVYSHQLDDKLN